MKDQDLKEAYSEAIEQYGRADLAYWKDRLFANCLHQSIVSQEVKNEEDTGAASPSGRISTMGFIYPPVIELPAELDNGFKKEGEKSLFLQDDDTESDKSKGSPKRMKLNSGRAVSPVLSNNKNTCTPPVANSAAETTLPPGRDAMVLE